MLIDIDFIGYVAGVAHNTLKGLANRVPVHE